MKAKDEIRIIRRYVRIERKRLNAIVTLGYKFEISCEGHGEMRNLLERQLVYTSEWTGAWKELKNPEVREEAVRYIMRAIEFSRNVA